jgi:hypothetical protein
VSALELAVAYLVPGAFEPGTILRLQESIGSHPSRVPCETKVRGAPLRPVGARNPGEKASTCENRSPFAIPSERA